jgi:c-di-GMP-binding flagellar brake protein YcgR
MPRENRRRSFRVTFPPDAQPRAELCPFGADDGAPPVPGRVADLSLGGAAVLFPAAVPTPLLQRPWVVGFELPVGVGVSMTLILTCSVAHRRNRPDGVLYGLHFLHIDQPVHAVQREALWHFLLNTRSSSAGAATDELPARSDPPGPSTDPTPI